MHRSTPFTNVFRLSPGRLSLPLGLSALPAGINAMAVGLPPLPANEPARLLVPAEPTASVIPESALLPTETGCP